MQSYANFYFKKNLAFECWATCAQNHRKIFVSCIYKSLEALIQINIVEHFHKIINTKNKS
jgi:hypothetical protein